MAGFPDIEGIALNWYGGTWQSSVLSSAFALAANYAVGTNPAYPLLTFLSMYPKFGGAPIIISGTLTAGSDSVPDVTPGNAPVTVGTFLATGTLPDGLYVKNWNTPALTLSAAATASQPNAALYLFPSPLVPIPILLVFITLASASIQQARYLEQWPFAMALYIAHYATLWLQSEGAPQTTAGQAVQAGLAKGLQVSKSADGLSVSYETLMADFEGWGTLGLTSYGQQLITIARLVGWGPRYIW